MTSESVIPYFWNYSEYILNLVENSVNYKANSIVVFIDEELMEITVVDNGLGITRKDMETIHRGLRRKNEERKKVKSIETLVRFRLLSDRMVIITKRFNAASAISMVFTKGKGARTDFVPNAGATKGTAILLRGLLFRNPKVVTITHLRTEQGKLITELSAMAVINPEVKFVVENKTTGIVFKSTDNTGLATAFKSIFDYKPSIRSLIPVHAQLSNFKINGFISTSTHHTKGLQLIYLNKTLFLETNIHDCFNNMLKFIFPFKNYKLSKVNLVYCLTLECPKSQYIVHHKKEIVFRRMNLIFIIFSRLIRNFTVIEGTHLYEASILRKKKINTFEKNQLKNLDNFNFEKKDHSGKEIHKTGTNEILALKSQTIKVFNNKLSMSIKDSLAFPSVSVNVFNMAARNIYMPKGASPIVQMSKHQNIAVYEGDTAEFPIHSLSSRESNHKSTKKCPHITRVADKKIFQHKGEDTDAYTLSKTIYEEVKILQQLDKKYILGNVSSYCAELSLSNEYLVVFDQHAVDERVMVEKLVAENMDNNGCLKRYTCEENWPLFTYQNDTIKILIHHKNFFLKSGIILYFLSPGTVAVTSIPEFVHRNFSQTSTSYYILVHEFLKMVFDEELENIKSTGYTSKSIPKSIYDLFCGEACKRAVKFGQELSKEDCSRLIEAGRLCQLPFQCAHGRPNLHLLARISPNSPQKRTEKLKKIFSIGTPHK